jgi:hypothetical protein
VTSTAEPEGHSAVNDAVCSSSSDPGGLTATAAAAAAAGQAVVFELIQQVQAPPPVASQPNGSDSTLAHTDIGTRSVADTDNETSGPTAPPLPPELWRAIFALLPLDVLLHASAVCRRWRAIVETDVRWTPILARWISDRPGFSAYKPKPRYSNFFTFNALVRAQPPVVSVTPQRPLPTGSSSGGGGTLRSRRDSTCARRVVLSTLADGQMCMLQREYYGPVERVPRKSVVAWAATAVDLFAGATGVRRMLLLPDGGIGVSSPAFSSNVFMAAPPDVRWSELPEPIFLPERQSKR